MFLWICWRFLEQHGDSASNPFSESGPHTPSFVPLSKDQISLENVDPEEEKVIAERLMASRNQIIMNNSIKEAQKSTDDLSRDLQASSLDDRVKPQPHESSKTRSKATQAAKERKALADKSRRERLREKARERLEDAQSDAECLDPTER